MFETEKKGGLNIRLVLLSSGLNSGTLLYYICAWLRQHQQLCIHSLHLFF